MSNEFELGNSEPQGISRRTVTKAMAWAVPVVAVASAAPAYAASGWGPTVEAGPAWKWPGSSCDGKGDAPDIVSNYTKVYLFYFRVRNTSPKPIYIYGFDISGGYSLDVIGTYPAIGSTTGYLIPANGYVDFQVWANSDSSANLNFCATVSVSWGHSAALNSDPDHHAPSVLTWTVCGTPTLESTGSTPCSPGAFVAAPTCTSKC